MNDCLRELLQSFDHDLIDQMPKMGPGFLLFHCESLLSKVYGRETMDSSPSVKGKTQRWFGAKIIAEECHSWLSFKLVVKTTTMMVCPLKVEKV